MATATAIAVVVTVAEISARMPNRCWLSANSAVHSVPVKKSTRSTTGCRKKETVGPMIATTIPIVVATETKAARKSTVSMPRSA